MYMVYLRKFCVAMGIFVVLAGYQEISASPIEHPVAGPGPFPYGSNSSSAISSPVEIDSYTFSGLAGDQARIVIAGLTDGFDPQLVLRDPGGSPLNTVHCDTGLFTCSTFLDQLLPSAGTYTINVSDAGLDNVGNYSLHLDQYPPPTNWVAVEYGHPIQNTLDHQSDSDYFGFLGAAGTGVQVSFAGNTEGLDPHLEIWDPDGTLIANKNCTTGLFTCVTSADLGVLQLSGIYKVGLSDLGFANTGNYTLGVSCTFGVCPVFPEPSTYALMLAGLAVVGMIARRKNRPSAE